MKNMPLWIEDKDRVIGTDDDIGLAIAGDITNGDRKVFHRSVNLIREEEVIA